MLTLALWVLGIMLVALVISFAHWVRVYRDYREAVEAYNKAIDRHLTDMTRGDR